MAKNEMKTKGLLTACIYFIAGLLLCLSVINVDGLLSIMLGILLILLAAILLLGGIIRDKKIAPETIVPTSFLLAVGISFLLWAFPFTGIMALFLTCVGGIIIIDAIMDIVGKKGQSAWLVKLIVGVIALALGICLLAIPEFREYASLVLGIILIIYAVLIALQSFSKKN